MERARAMATEAVALHEHCVCCLANDMFHLVVDGKRKKLRDCSPSDVTVVLLSLVLATDVQEVRSDLCFYHRRQVDDGFKGVMSDGEDGEKGC